MRVHAIGMAAVLATLFWTASPASAQQRPLVTEDPETVGAGRLLFEAGLDLERDAFYPLSGLRGNLFAVPTVGVSIGAGSIVEIQIDGGLYQRLSVTGREPAPLAHLLDFTGDRTTSIKDMVVATKIRITGETASRPAMALRVATQLPNASNESGLGRDVIDFSSSFLIGKTVQSIRVVANAGLLILEDPVQAARQDDLFIYGLSLARALVEGFEVVGEVNGRVNFTEIIGVGAEDRVIARAGLRYTYGPVRFDGALLFGLTPRDPNWGITTGLTWVVNAFNVP